jgi:hypothetical protein
MTDPITPDQMLAVVGDFWASVYAGRDLVRDLLAAQAELDAQTQDDLVALVNSLSRDTVAPYQTVRLFPLVLKESDRNRVNLATFNGTFLFDGTIAYDVPFESQAFAWATPAGLADVTAIGSAIKVPAAVFTEGIDYTLDPGSITFLTDPFVDPRVEKQAVYADGVIADRTCTLWLYASRWDRLTVHTQYGYVLGGPPGTGFGYRAFVNASFDSMVEGTTAHSVEDLFSSACGVPLAGGVETVELVATDTTGLWVVTDKAAYPFAVDSTAVVVAGDAVMAGDRLVDTLTFYPFNRGQLPPDLRALAVGRGFLPEGYLAELVFENKSVITSVEMDVDGYTKFSFPLGGFPTDVEQFWDAVHASGVAAGQTIAMLLDRRPVDSRTTQPTGLALPKSVNPLEFLIENVLRANAFAVRIRSGLGGPSAAGIDRLRILRKVIPPPTACFLVTEHSFSDEAELSGDGTTTSPGYEQELTTFAGLTIPEDEVDPADMIEESIRAYPIRGRCV